MKNITLSNSNIYDDKARQFIESRHGRRLIAKFEPKPYEKKYKSLRLLSLFISYFCNIFSIISGSTFVYFYFAVILAGLQYGPAIAGAITLILLCSIELFQRATIPTQIKDIFQYGAKAENIIMLSIVFLFAVLSVFFSFHGSAELVRSQGSPPVYEAPVLENSAALERTAAEYKTARLYKNRLSGTAAKDYNKLLERAEAAKSRNRTAIKEAKQEYKTALAGYQKRASATGLNLGYAAIIIQILFFMTMAYNEYYDFRTIIQYSQLGTEAGARGRGPQEPAQIPADDTAGARLAPPANKIGFNNEQNQFKQAQTVVIDDKYTILHNGKRLNKAQINNRISIYEKRVHKAEAAGKVDTMNRNKKQLLYFIGLRNELRKKASQ